MLQWIGRAMVGLLAFSGTFFVSGLLLDAVGVSSVHHIPHIDAYGEYREGGSTRAGLVSGLASTFAAIWGVTAFLRRRFDAGWSASDWRSIGFAFSAILAYTTVMTLLNVTLSIYTRDIPDPVFALLDLAMLGGSAFAAYRLHQRSRIL